MSGGGNSSAAEDKRHMPKRLLRFVLNQPFDKDATAEALSTTLELLY